MPDWPHLRLPSPTISDERSRAAGGPPPGLHVPSAARQGARLRPRFEAITREFARRRARLQRSAAGIVPELVLVFEVAGSIANFEHAVRRIQGFEWMAEQQDEMTADDDFYFEEDDGRDLSRSVYLVLSNAAALDELLRLWRRHIRAPGEKFERPFGRYKDLFRLLRDIRPWNTRDRLANTGVLDDWRERIAAGSEDVPVEIELWFRASHATRAEASAQVREALTELGGRVLAECEMPEIRYHALLARLPSEAAARIIEERAVKLAQCEQIMFFMPSGQCSVRVGAEPTPMDTSQRRASESDALGEPVAALLDGLPIENHDLLANRLLVDDPDGWSSDYPVALRGHGTAMASIVLHGDLNGVEPALFRRIYVRPIMRPVPSGFPSELVEAVPEPALPIDLVNRAVTRIVEGEGGSPPVARSVRVINLSVADKSRVFDNAMSPWARLLDWLAWKHKLLFVVSAGNHEGRIKLDRDRAAFNLSVTPIDDLRRLTIRGIADAGWERRLLAPSETVNGLTIGAAQSDALAGYAAPSGRRDPIEEPTMSSPVSAVGPGYLRSIKPDVVCSGGRVLVAARPGTGHAKAELDLLKHPNGPGVRAASPGSGTRGTIWTSGTSIAAAMTTRVACETYESLLETGLLDEERAAVMLKALLVHGASWGTARDYIRASCDGGDRDVARLVGYGSIDGTRSVSSAAHRATMLWAGDIGFDEGHLHGAPLPSSLRSTTAWRRLVVTLAWLSPVNPANYAYRQAALWFDSIHGQANPLRAQRIGQENHHMTVRRGTVQHEVLQGEQAAAFRENEQVVVKVSARKTDGDPLVADRRTRIPYALAITMEVGIDSGLRVYEEVRAKLQARVRV